MVEEIYVEISDEFLIELIKRIPNFINNNYVKQRVDIINYTTLKTKKRKRIQLSN